MTPSDAGGISKTRPDGERRESGVERQSQRPPARPSSPRQGDDAPSEDRDGDNQSASDKEDRQHSKDGDDNKPDEKDDAKEKRPFWKRPILLGVMVGGTLLIAAGALVWWLMTRNYADTDDAFIDGRIIHVAPRVAGRIVSLNVDDNQYVTADTVVVNIDPAPFETNRANAAASVAQAQTKVAQAEADLAAQQAMVAQYQANVEVAQANATEANADFNRYQNVPAAARSQQQLDTARARMISTNAQITQAQKQVVSAQSQVESATKAIAAARAQVAAYQAQLDQANLDLQYTHVTAGEEGYITRRTVEKGNYVQTGQEILAIVSKNIWVTANYKETQLTYMKPGQPATVTIDAYPHRRWRMHVDSIQAGTGAVFTTLPPENATGNYVKIVQRVPVKLIFDEPPDRPLALGESVLPSVDISSGR